MFFISKNSCDDMLNIIKEKDYWTKNYTSTSITLEKGRIIRLKPSNLVYVNPHKVKMTLILPMLII